MRITGITITGFGGVSGEMKIDLDADVVILVGANGYGKTTVCNAVSWAISGLSPSTQGPRNLYSRTGTTTVELRIDLKGEDVLITRSLDNPDETDVKKLRTLLRVHVNNKSIRGAEAEMWLRQYLSGSDTNEDFVTYAQSFVESIYLRQESLREFLTGREDTARFDAVANMVGAGRLREFTEAIQSQKRAWVRTVNQEEKLLEGDRAKLEDLATSLSILESEITRVNTDEVIARWGMWLADILTLGIIEAHEVKDRELDEKALTKLRAALNHERSKIEREEESLLSALAELSVKLPENPDVNAISESESQLNKLAVQKAALEQQIQELRKAVGESEAILRRASTVREDLANIASILLRHVEDNCAACGQTVDQDAYRRRLEGLSKETEDSALREQVDLQRTLLLSTEKSLGELSMRLTTSSDGHRSLLEQRMSALAARERRESRLKEVLESLSNVELPAMEQIGFEIPIITVALDRLTARKTKITQLLEEERQFEAAASLESTKIRRDRLATEHKTLSESLATKELDILDRRRTDDTVAAILEAVKTDEETFVDDRLAQLRPLLRQFYASIDPHPTFRTVEIATHRFGGKHRLAPLLRDDEFQVDVPDPGGTLSTSQANALAVSLFLSFNLGFAPTHVKSLILDDPLQNLDDVHLLGLVDLLRKILPHRQLIVTTHDQAFASLLARKLRPVHEGSRTTHIRFTKWDRNGPGIEQWDVVSESSSMKLVDQ